MNHFAANLRRLRLDKHLTQEQVAEKLSVSAQSVSRWETSATLPDVMLLPEIARLYGVLVDDLFKPSPKGYENNALRLLAVFEHTGKPEDFLAAQQEFKKLLRNSTATADDWRSCGVAHEYMVYHCIRKATDCYDKALEISRAADPEMYHRTLRQKTLLRSRTGQSAACIAEQEATLRQQIDDVNAWIDLAHALSCSGDPERVVSFCRDGLVRFPQSALLHLFAGDAHRALKQYDEAFSHWEDTLRLDDKYTDAMFSMAFCREELGQYAEAAVIWEEIARKLDAQGLEIEAKWPREMAEKCRQRLHT